MATTGISLIREQTEAMRLPRFLWVPFELGRPFGAPNEPGFQRRVLRKALELLERSDGPVVLADFADNAPVTDDELVWACPISFAPEATDEPELVEAALTELRKLAPWAELAPPPPPNSPMELDEIVSFLGQLAEGTDVSDLLGEQSLVNAARLAADDLRSWYLHAVAQQPGSATTAERMTWFWRQTALGRLLGEVAGRLLEDPDPMVRNFGERAVVPRDHMASLIPDLLPTIGETNA